MMINKNALFYIPGSTGLVGSAGIETRPIIAGNITRQPFLINNILENNPHMWGADEIHFMGLYIGNSHILPRHLIDYLICVLEN